MGQKKWGTSEQVLIFVLFFFHKIGTCTRSKHANMMLLLHWFKDIFSSTIYSTLFRQKNKTKRGTRDGNTFFSALSFTILSTTKHSWTVLSRQLVSQRECIAIKTQHFKYEISLSSSPQDINKRTDGQKDR